MDERRDTGEVYPGGTMIYRQRQASAGGDVKHSEFASIGALVGEATMNEIIEKVNTVVTALKG